jgi:hypothetical protein
MPYVIRPTSIPGGALVACSALLAFGAASAQANSISLGQTASETQACEEPPLSQPFSYAGDNSYYALAAGQTEDEFEGQGWTLSSGASIVATPLADATTGKVLNMPSGSKAVSPVICVTSAYPKARMMVRNVTGRDPVGFSVAYKGTATWEKPKSGGDVKGSGNQAWTLSNPVNMSPEHVEGWQLVQITLVAKGNASDLQINNLYIDPYRR